MTQRVTGQRFRQRKLSTKQNIPVLREHEVEKLDDDEASRHIPKVETGVEKGEEIVSLCASHFGPIPSMIERWTYLARRMLRFCKISNSFKRKFVKLILTTLAGASFAGRHICSAGSSSGCYRR